VWLGLGAGVLAVTRPYEGALAAVSAGAIFVLTLWRSRAGVAPLSRVAIPALVVSAAALAWVGYYNHRVTGDSLRFPYTEYDRQYEIEPLWRWQTVREEPPGLNRPMHDFARWEVTSAAWSNEPRNRGASLYRTLAFETGPVLAPAILLLLPWTLRSRRVRLASLALFVVTGGTLLVNYFQIHYHAPAAPLAVLLATCTLERIAAFGRVRRAGRGVVMVLLAATVGIGAYGWWAESRTPERLMTHWAAVRDGLERSIPPTAGGHVVFVRYGRAHNPHLEVVFNGADIDRSPVVWVRDLGAEQNGAVLRYFGARTPWLLVFDDDRMDPRLSPYAPLEPAPGASGAGGAH
jgi:hypothetical protein